MGLLQQGFSLAMLHCPEVSRRRSRNLLSSIDNALMHTFIRVQCSVADRSCATMIYTALLRAQRKYLLFVRSDNFQKYLASLARLGA